MNSNMVSEQDMAEASSSSLESLGLSTIVDVTAIVKVLNFTLPTKLSMTNYICWKVQVKSVVRGLGLDLLISKPQPKDLEGLEQEIWIQADHMLMVWFFTNIGERFIGQVIKCSSSDEIWSTLEKLFAQASMARVLQSKQQLNNFKKGSSSISEFVLKVKNLGAKLKSIDQVISDSDLIQAVLNGLGHEFDPVVVLISSQQRTMSLQDAQYLLMLHEQRIEQLN
ncbi:hypothetical protein Scep_025769 [Stephania cephalantha]|uniref:Uncharacterized protein n=1 Tax=Stephania cephalantha TaxID=152367 RepID=A0AAP0EIT7_9MAGN